MAELANASPGTLLGGDAPRLIDEWQLAPPLWNAVRHEVDRRREPGQFILTGSATPEDDVTRHSGAGRFGRVTLRPMTIAESGQALAAFSLADIFESRAISGYGGPTVEDYAAAIERGGWPALIEQPRRSATSYLSSYLDDIARVDLPGADLRIDPVRMQALMRALARNTATEVTAARLSEEAEIDAPAGTSVSAQSVRKYLDALTRIFVLEEQPAWAPHLRSKIRLRVQPKWHFIDPSLAAAALGASRTALLGDPKTLGLFFESLCIRDLRVHAGALGGRVYHYRDETGLEVDAIVELTDWSWSAFEVKLGGVKSIDAAARNLIKLSDRVSQDRGARLRTLNVLTAGNASYRRPDGVNVVALGHLGPTAGTSLTSTVRSQEA
ncbi:MAG TPA: DUF4143 domain-containing protein [Trueperaceae bacterium]|nr:DUF4143 domain-containing protein [Trueperaceae bacterium]